MTTRKAYSGLEAMKHAMELGFPILVEPNSPLGHCRTKLCHTAEQLRQHLNSGVFVTNHNPVTLHRKNI